MGCGAIGSGYDQGRDNDPPLSHAGAYRAYGSTRLVGGVDPDEAARKRFEDLWGLPCYSELDAALEEQRPTVVSVCNPAESHSVTVERLVAADIRAIWIEKPLADTRSNGEHLVASCIKADVALQVNFLRRFDPLHQSVAKILRDGPPLLHADFRFSGSTWDFGAHAFDLFRWFTGDPVWARAIRLSTEEPLAVLGAASGAVGTFSRVPSETIEMFECYLFTGERMLLWLVSARIC